MGDVSEDSPESKRESTTALHQYSLKDLPQLVHLGLSTEQRSRDGERERGREGEREREGGGDADERDAEILD